MNKIEKAIQQFRSDPEHARLFDEALAEVTLSERMADLRLIAKLTQKELADRLNVSQAYIAKLETGGYDRCGIGHLRTIALACGHELRIDAMFEPNGRGYAALAVLPRITSPAREASKVINFTAFAREREHAVG